MATRDEPVGARSGAWDRASLDELRQRIKAGDEQARESSWGARRRASARMTTRFEDDEQHRDALWLLVGVDGVMWYLVHQLVRAVLERLPRLTGRP